MVECLRPPALSITSRTFRACGNTGDFLRARSSATTTLMGQLATMKASILPLTRSPGRRGSAGTARADRTSHNLATLLSA